MDKRKITLFYDGAWYTFRWLKTMLWASDYFRKYGYEVSFLNEDEYVHSDDKTKIFESSVLNNEFDIVFLAYHDSHVGLCSLAKDKFAYLMSVLRKRSNVLVWLDTSDSTGNIYKEAFGYVDKYLKKQIYSD